MGFEGRELASAQGFARSKTNPVGAKTTSLFFIKVLEPMGFEGRELASAQGFARSKTNPVGAKVTLVKFVNRNFETNCI